MSRNSSSDLCIICIFDKKNVKTRREIYNNLQDRIQLYEKMILYLLAQVVSDCYNKTTKSCEKQQSSAAGVPLAKKIMGGS
ncbi:hypothetical protein [Clostridium sp.]